ncbi:TPA: pentapeptide repeat-containing protein [Yersinia enterocolitica]|nr:pentapeptide repeat-containing protein [Yersinia enterocolitica]
MLRFVDHFKAAISKRVDFVGADLSGANLADAILTDIIIFNIIIEGAILPPNDQDRMNAQSVIEERDENRWGSHLSYAFRQG